MSCFSTTSTGTAGGCGSSVIMCKWSRPALLCIRQETCVTSEMVAYTEQWFGGLVSETSYCGEWCSVLFHEASLWFVDRTGWLWGEKESRDHRLNTSWHPLSNFIFVFKELLLSSGLCRCWHLPPLSFFAVYLSVCLYQENVFYYVVLLPICHVTFLFLFVCLSVCLPGCQFPMSICLLSRHFTDSQWLREAWSASLSWLDFKIDSLARTPCTHNITKTGLSL